MINIRTICILLIVCGTLLSCGGETDSSANNTVDPGSSIIELRISTMFGGNDPATEVYLQAIREFAQLHEDVRIIDESMNSGEDFIAKIRDNFASNNEADVTFYFTGTDGKQIINTGAVVPFDDLLMEDLTWSSKMYKNPLDMMRFTDGKIYSIPITGFYEGVLCNKDLFEKYQLELPYNWNSFIKAINVFKENGITPIAASLDESYYLIDNLILSVGGPAGHDSAFKNGVDPSWITGLEYIKVLYDMGAFPENAFVITDAEAQQIFGAKNAAMMVNGSWAVGAIPEKDNIWVLPFPVVPNGKAGTKDIIAGFTSGYYLSKKSHEDPSKKQMALELIKFLTTPAMVERFVGVNGGVPAADIDIKGVAPVFLQGHAMVTNASTLSLPIDSKIAVDAFSHIRKNVPDIVSGVKTARDVVNEAYRIHTEITQK